MLPSSSRSPRRHCLFGCLAVALAAVGTPTEAHAQDPGPPESMVVAPPDTIYLRDGGMVRGRVQEILPGDHVTVALEMGEVRRIPWSSVDRAIVASAPSIPPMVAAPPPPAPAPQIVLLPPPAYALAPSTPPPVGPTVRVHLATVGSTLYRTPAGTGDITRVCYAPCDLDLPLGDEYRMGAEGNTSKAFRIQGTPGHTVTLAVDPPSTGGIVAGGALIAGGGALVSAMLDLAAVNTLTGASGTTGELLTVAGGVGAMVLGTIVVFNSLSTDVTQQAPSGSKPLAKRVFTRDPMWHVAERGAFDPPGPSGVTIPLFTAHF